MPKAEAVHVLCVQIAQADLPEPELEYLFAPVVDGKPIRRWRFDLCWPRHELALEIDGGMFGGGRHGGARSSVRDLEKRNCAQLMGWNVIHVTPSQVRNGDALRWLLFAFDRGPLPI